MILQRDHHDTMKLKGSDDEISLRSICVFFNMISNYSSLLNNIMAVLDFKDNTHPNLNEDKRTGFNINDLKKNILPQFASLESPLRQR